MNIKRKWFLFLIAALVVTSACNLVSNVFNPVDEVVSEIEELADQVDIEEIEEELDMLATEIPSSLDELPGLDELPDLDDLGDLGDLGDLEATVQALQEGFGSDEIPPDIPVVDKPAEILFGSDDLVSYTTQVEFDSVLSFYQEEMPLTDWQPNDDGTVITAEAAVLRYTKADRDAIVTVSVQDGITYVMITIQPR